MQDDWYHENNRSRFETKATQKHEPRCLDPITCTCVTILRERIIFLEMNSNILRNEWLLEREKRFKVEADKASNDADYLKCAAERNSLENKLKDGLSCCCSGCTRHNLILASHEEIGKDKLTVKYD